MTEGMPIRHFAYWGGALADPFASSRRDHLGRRPPGPRPRSSRTTDLWRAFPAATSTPCSSTWRTGHPVGQSPASSVSSQEKVCPAAESLLSALDVQRRIPFLVKPRERPSMQHFPKNQHLNGPEYFTPTNPVGLGCVGMVTQDCRLSLGRGDEGAG